MFFVTEDGGLTTGGYFLTAIIIFALLILSSALFRGKKKAIDARIIAFCAVSIALGSVASLIKLWDMPMGGAVTLFSMLFVVLAGYWYGPAIGLITGVAYGLLQMIMDPYVISLPQLLIDYVLGFGALGLSGFFCNKKNGLMIGYVTGICARFIFSTLSGVIFFADYAPETMSPLVYSALYNGGYIFAEGLVTVIILTIPAVRKAMVYVKTMATS